MENKTSKGIKIIEDNPEILNNYLRAVSVDDKNQIESSSKALSDHIIRKVHKAIKVFYKNDIYLLESKMNEMTVCGRLAMYLQEEFKDFKGYYVDIEYYRLKVPRKNANLRDDRIRCDILFHSRGAYNSRVDNLLAIEAKLDGNSDDGGKDRSRLADFVMSETENTPEGAVHSTLVGLCLRFGKKCSIMRINPVEDNVDIEDI